MIHSSAIVRRAVLGIVVAVPSALGAQGGTWALTNARIETVTKGLIERGTIVIRDGLIVAVGTTVPVPADARVLDLSGRTISPGLIDLMSGIGLSEPAALAGGGRGGGGGGPAALVTVAPRFSGFDPERVVADELRLSVADARAAREGGVTAVLVAPSRGALRGLSALVPAKDSADGRAALRSPVAQHLGFQGGGGGFGGGEAGTPGTIMGVIAYQRQAFHDARRHGLLVDRWRAEPRGVPRPPNDPGLEALVPVVRGTLPAFYEAGNENEIRRAVRVAKEFDLKLTIVGATEGWRALDALAGRPVVVSVNFPVPSAGTGWSYRQAQRREPGDSAALDREARKLIEANPAAVHKGGIRFALASGRTPASTFLANARKAVAAGLPADVALQAMTIRPAEMTGLGDALGSIEVGKIANLVVTEGGGILSDSARVRAVFIDGERFEVTPPPAAGGRGGGRGAPPDDGAPLALLALAAPVAGAQPVAAPGVAPFTMPIPPAARLVAITNATILTASHGTIQRGTILIRDGKIAEVGSNVAVPAGAQVIDGTGKFVTPGIIDAHSHSSLEGINEGSSSVTAEVELADAVRQDGLTFYRQLAGGVTAANLLHGSANTIGGKNVTVKLRWGLPVDSMIFQQAPPGIKFALGENVRQTNSQPQPGRQPRYPRTRMGVEELLRERFTAARDYQAEWAAFTKAKAALKRGEAEPIPPRRDVELDVLVEILEGKRLVHAHSYRSDEIYMLLKVAKDFGFRIASLQHVLEGYKVADEIAAAGTGASTFADMWGYKLEAWDAIAFNSALMAERGVRVSVNSDSDERARRLYQDAAKAMHYGETSEEEALKMITLNAAWQLGVDKYTGSIDVGKDADIAIFSAHPFSSAARVEMTLVDGRVFFDRKTAPTLEALMEQLRRTRAAMDDGGIR
ncbi:MAG TPA: amidohydrolase family protein [Gemmatimonadaceae bacterium]|nr:amidohydrolase family protein [Gemmatimonadaceae bacterium]